MSRDINSLYLHMIDGNLISTCQMADLKLLLGYPKFPIDAILSHTSNPM
jgi:hypothetical protein